MPQNIELNHTAFDGMVVKMSRDDARLFFIGRMLNRRKCQNIHIAGTNHNASRMLAGGIFDLGDASQQTLRIDIIRHQLPLLRVLFYIAKGGAILNTADCPGAKHIVAPE